MTLEELEAKYLELQEENKTLKASNETLTTRSKELAERNDKLVEHNNKLFARLSQPTEQEPKPLTAEEEEEKVMAEIVEKMKNYK